jgi:AcrR family transcriptional regulator
MGGHFRFDPAAQSMTFASAPKLVGRRSDIVDATLALAFEVGPDAVSTSLIAKRLGLTQPALYKHFKTKDAIWLEISLKLSDRIRKNVQDCASSTLAPEHALRNLICRHLAFIQDVPALPDIMVMRHDSKPSQALRHRLQTEMSHLRTLMVDLIQLSQDRKIMRNDIGPTDIATLIIGVVQSLVLRMIVSRDPSRLAIEGARLFDLQIEILAARGVPS